MEKRKFRTITLIADIVILTISFLAMVWTKPASLKIVSAFTYSILFRSGSDVDNCFSCQREDARGKIINFTTLFTRVLTSNIIAISITALVMYTFRDYDYSRTIVLGTALLATILELLFGSVYIAYKKAVVQDYEDYDKYKTYKKPSEYDLVREVNGNGVHHETNH